MSDRHKMFCSRRIQVVLSLFLVTVSSADGSSHTYEWTDESGNPVLCQKCPPGSYVAKHCSSKSDTVCQACPEEHYAQYWNYLDKCRFCNVICQEGEMVKRECNSTHNRVCECQPGYHRDGDYCLKDVQCNFQDVIDEKSEPWNDKDVKKRTVLDNEDCDKLVIDFIASLNMTSATFRRLELKISSHKGRKPNSQRRIRNLLKEYRNREPDHPLLPRLLHLLKEAKISSLEKRLRKKFLEQEEQ